MTTPTAERAYAQPALAAWALSACLALAVAGSVYFIPIQVDDSLEVIVRSASIPTLTAAFVDGLHASRTMLRPLKQVHTKLLLDAGAAAGGRYHLAFRGFHAILAALVVLLFAHLHRPRTWPEVAGLAFGLMVLTGMPTFAGLLREAYPVNHFLLVAVYGMVLIALAQSRGGWVVDAAAVTVCAAALLTLESGLLLVPAVVVAHYVGWRGISRRALLAIAVLACGYGVLRFGYLGIGAAGLGERATGFAAGVLSADEQRIRFGAEPFPFYAYNVVSSVLTVLLSQPESGQWTVAYEWSRGDVPPVLWLGLLTSVPTTLVIGWHMLDRSVDGRRRWRDPAALVFLLFLTGSALLGYAYSKPETLGLAGMFYAVMAANAMSTVLAGSRRRASWLAVLLIVVSAGWGVRSAGLHFKLRHGAFDAHGGWSSVLPPDDQAHWPADARTMSLLGDLKREAVARRVTTARALPRIYQRWWGQD